MITAPPHSCTSPMHTRYRPTAHLSGTTLAPHRMHSCTPPPSCTPSFQCHPPVNLSGVMAPPPVVQRPTAKWTDPLLQGNYYPRVSHWSGRGLNPSGPSHWW